MTEKNAIRILIVDDHDVVRHGLAIFIEHVDDFELVGQAGDGEEAIRLCNDVQPDVILMDMVMPGINGVQATQAILDHQPKIRVIALTSFQEQDLVQQALHAGAVGYVLKNTTVEDLEHIIRSAYAGQVIFSEEVARALLHSNRGTPAQDYQLTARELEVLGLMVHGLRNKNIAEQLGVSLYTVKSHVRAIFTKLDVHDRTEAVALALREKLVTN